MEIHKVQDENNGVTIGLIGTDTEYVNAFDYYRDGQIKMSMARNKEMLKRANAIMEAGLTPDFYEKKAVEEWDRLYEPIKNTQVPNNFISLLTSTTKKEQERLMRGQSLTHKQLAAFLFTACQDFGYTFSSYTSEHLPKGTDLDNLPALVSVSDDDVRVVGETTMSKGQLKQMVEQRKVIVAKFLDKGSEWHCLLATYRSIGGGETYKGDQPHFHYLSDKWGPTREEAVASIKGGKYPTTSVHIDLAD